MSLAFRLQGHVGRLAREHGQVFTVKQASYVSDPDGGGTIRDAANDTTVTVYGVVQQFRHGQIDDVNVQADDVRVHLEALDTAGTAWTCNRGDRITVEGREMRVLDPRPIKPGGTVVAYDAHVGIRSDL